MSVDNANIKHTEEEKKIPPALPKSSKPTVFANDSLNVKKKEIEVNKFVSSNIFDEDSDDEDLPGLE